MSKRRAVFIAVCALGAVIALFQCMRLLELSRAKPENRGDPNMRYEYEPTIEVDGVTYRERGRVTAILLMGIDKEGQVAKGYYNGGQADFLRLLILDDERKTVSQIQIDRDTMTPIVTLGVLGNRSGTRNAQISLSHGFGDGKEESCELTVEAVSNLFLNAPIDYYVSLSMDGISVLNDWAGGVTITIEEDLTAIDPQMRQGATLTLLGDQAEKYVRTRMSVGDGTNASRMKRQQIYIDQLVKQMEKKLGEDQSQMNDLMDALEGYLVTDMPRGRIINEFWAAKDYERTPLIEPGGIHEVSKDGFMEFEVDREQLKEIVLELFYKKVD